MPLHLVFYRRVSTQYIIPRLPRILSQHRTPRVSLICAIRLSSSSVSPPTGSSIPVPYTTDSLEEETLPLYRANAYYPVQLGRTYQERYKTVAKLGYGTASTVWLCQDLEANTYKTVKFGNARNPEAELDNELGISRHLSPLDGSEHPGKQGLRLAVDDFTLTSTSGTHQCLVFTPLGTSLTKLRSFQPGRVFHKILLQWTLQQLLLALDFLRQADVVHTDICPNNILIGANDDSIFAEVEKFEQSNPCIRKHVVHRTVYTSVGMPITVGNLIITDFGNARLGASQTGDAMPNAYRAPEVILDMQWGSEVDVWSAGLMIWNLYEGATLFDGTKNGVLDDEQHLAEMVSIMGPPPKAFLDRSPNCAKYWDSEGRWTATTPIPDQSLETLEKRHSGVEQASLLALVRRFLRWLPEERPTTVDPVLDDFFTLPA